jgi:hypothetical protein
LKGVRLQVLWNGNYFEAIKKNLALGILGVVEAWIDSKKNYQV